MKLGVRQRWLAVGIMFLAAGGLFTLALTRSDGSATESSEPSSEPTTGPFRFVVVGDYGEGGGAEAKIAGCDRSVDRSQPDQRICLDGRQRLPIGCVLAVHGRMECALRVGEPREDPWLSRRSATTT